MQSVNGTFKSTAKWPTLYQYGLFHVSGTDLPSNTTLPRLLGNSGRNTVIGPISRTLMFPSQKQPVHRISETSTCNFDGDLQYRQPCKLQSATTWEPSIFLVTGGRECQRRLLNATSTTSAPDAVRPKIHLVSDFCVQSDALSEL